MKKLIHAIVRFMRKEWFLLVMAVVIALIFVLAEWIAG
jgi:hypothetical protein